VTVDAAIQWDEQWDEGGAVARTHVVLSEEVIEAIDEQVGQRGRSRFLEEAAREKLERLELETALRKGSGILKAKDYPHWRDRDATRRWVKEMRSGEAS
jgi:hypothetical protein